MTGLRNTPDPKSARLPLCETWDAVGLGISINLITIPTATRASNRIEITGYRRYRLKWRIDDQGHNADTVDVRLLDTAYNRLSVWENVLIAGIPFGANGANVINFGEGTGILETFQGPFLLIAIRNMGAFNMFIREVELYAGG